MGRPQKKLTGAEKKAIAKAQTTQYISRTRAMRKLQLTLPQFRRLCVLKGIHPVEPATKKLSKHRTFYHQMDIRFIGHDPLINSIREQNIFKKKTAKAGARKADGALRRLMANKPVVNIDHIVRERYPTFIDALNDLEDPLCMVFVCARMRSNAFLKPQLISECLRLSSEFLTYVAQSNSLRKVFVTIKGIYYQAEIMGTTINWLVPLEYALKDDDRVDERLISNFVEFYVRMLSFVNYKLYASIGLEYPPRPQKASRERGDELAFTLHKIKKIKDNTLEEAHKEKSAKVREALEQAQQLHGTEKPTGADKKRISTLTSKLNKFSKMDEESTSEQEAEIATPSEPIEIPTEVEAPSEADITTEENATKLFKDLVFFVNREVPLVHLNFMIKSFHGRVSFSGGDLVETSTRITHQIVDKEYPATSRVQSREYVQPQWVFDSINAGILLPVHEYAPEAILPPHLSPFVTSEEEGYVPDQRKHLDELIQRETNPGVVEQDSEAEEDQDEEEEGEDKHSVEARYYDELMQERSGLTFSEVSRVKEEKKRIEQEAMEAHEAEEIRVHEAAGIAYVKPKKPSRKDLQAKAQEEKKKEKQSLVMSVMGRGKRDKIKKIEERQAQKKEEIQRFEDKKLAINERKLDGVRNKMKEQQTAPVNIATKKRSKNSDNKQQAKKHKM